MAGSEMERAVRQEASIVDSRSTLQCSSSVRDLSDQDEEVTHPSTYRRNSSKVPSVPKDPNKQHYSSSHAGNSLGVGLSPLRYLGVVRLSHTPRSTSGGSRNVLRCRNGRWRSLVELGVRLISGIWRGGVGCPIFVGAGRFPRSRAGEA